jgi:hypothetical protein
MKRQLIAICLFAGFILIGCSDNKKVFLGQHTFMVPLLTVDHDTTQTTYDFGMKLHPQVNYYDLYAANIEFYNTSDQWDGQLKFKYPERPVLFSSHKSEISEKILKLTNIHFAQDTLKFIIETNNFLQKVSMEGVAFELNGKIVVGLPKKLLNANKSKCTKNIILDTPLDYALFATNRIIDKKAFYNCQIDSLKEYVSKHPDKAFINSEKLAIKFISKMAK